MLKSSLAGLLVALSLTAYAQDAAYSRAYPTNLKIWNESARTESALTISVTGEGARHIYDSLAAPEQPHRGLYIKNSSDGKIFCQRAIPAADYFCQIDLVR